MGARIDFQDLKLSIDSIICGSSTNYPISREEADNFRLIGADASKRKNLPIALEFSVKAGKIYENLLKRNEVDERILYLAAQCYDYAGKYSGNVALVASKKNEFDWEYVFNDFAVQFKNTGGDLYVRVALLDREDRLLRFKLAAGCYERAAWTLSRILGDYEPSARLRRKSAYFYEKSGDYKEIIWLLSRAIEDVCHFDKISKKIPMGTIERWLLKLEKLRKEHGNPENFNLRDLIKTVNEARKKEIV